MPSQYPAAMQKLIDQFAHGAAATGEVVQVGSFQPHELVRVHHNPTELVLTNQHDQDVANNTVVILTDGVARAGLKFKPNTSLINNRPDQSLVLIVASSTDRTIAVEFADYPAKTVQVTANEPVILNIGLLFGIPLLGSTTHFFDEATGGDQGQGNGNGGNSGNGSGIFTDLVGCTESDGVLTYTDGVINGTFAYSARLNQSLDKIYVKVPDLLNGDPNSFGIIGSSTTNFQQDSPDKTYMNITSSLVIAIANNSQFIFNIKADGSNASGDIIEIDFVNRKIKNVTANYQLVDQSTSADTYAQATGTSGKPAFMLVIKQANDVSLLAGHPVAIYQSQPEQA